MNIDNFIKGWLVGDFDPALIKSKDIEIAVKHYKTGEFEIRHVHKLVTEYTIVLSGMVLMNGCHYGKNSIIKINPMESTDFHCAEDATTLVIKTPSIPSDKEFV